MVIHSSPGRHRKKKMIPKEEVLMTPVVFEKEVVINEVVEIEQKSDNILPIDDPTAEEFIATLPKKQYRKKVTKVIEE
jgi:hypothetical protein